MSAKPSVLVLRAAGTNCDYETAFAFERSGARVESIHINRLIEAPRRLLEFHILAVPGGFTYGDDIAAGQVLANEMRFKLGDALEEFLAGDRLAIGICNGFQVFTKAGILPGPFRKKAERTASLCVNDSNRFEDRWTYLRCETDRCVFAKKGELLYLPVAHGEGKFVAEPETLARLNAEGRVVFRYTDPEGRLAGYPWNPNGSLENIAGICDPTGRVLGLMPHPERHFLHHQHPYWTRLPERTKGDGAVIFERAVAYFR